MIIEAGYIKFEYRDEVDAVLYALEDWADSHKADPTVKELIRELDYMSLCW